MVLAEVMGEERTAAPVLPAGPFLRRLNDHGHGYACANDRVYCRVDGRGHDVRESGRGRENGFRESGRENASAAYDPHANRHGRDRDHDERGRMLRDQ